MSIEEKVRQRQLMQARLGDRLDLAKDRAQRLRVMCQDAKEGAVVRHEERQVMQGHPLDLYPTPIGLADRMVAMAWEYTKDLTLWLEPSAGTGVLAEAMRRQDVDPLCVELNVAAVQLLRKRGFEVLQMDWLQCRCAARVILMNPPFSKDQDIAHVRHAYDCLLMGGGILVGIMSEGSFGRQRSEGFVSWFEAIGGISEALPEGTFKHSGTMVRTRLIRMIKT